MNAFRSRSIVLAALGLLAWLAPAGPAAAAPGDTTWVNTFNQEFINWATPHYATFTMPSDPSNWSKIVMFLTIECPGAPDDCDPWDRLGHLRIATPDQGDVEIARFITPYDITGGSYPGSCAWTHNVTRYKSLLQDATELRLYVESWIGGTNGWLISIDFAFIEGILDPEPYRVVNLWQKDRVVYGDPSNPVTAHIQPMQFDVEPDVTKAEVRVYTTGHGQGSTANCAEFCSRTHSVVADGTTFSHSLWRSNCSLNSCSPQGGTWASPRAGWCPGDRAQPWNLDVTSAITPGSQATLDYQIEAYENLCRPNNPTCVAGVTCVDCNYNSTGHTEPHYTIHGQAILWKPRASVVSVDLSDLRDGSAVRLGQNAPNPFRPRTEFEYTLPAPADAEILIYDAAGRLVVDEARVHSTAGTYRFAWTGTDAEGKPVAAGVYFYSVRVDGKTQTRKMIRVR
jgi:hypothetical protein